MLDRIYRIASSPFLTLISGVILLVTSGVEIFDSIEEGSLASEHGIFAFGFIQIIRALPEILLGLKEVTENAERADP